MRALLGGGSGCPLRRGRRGEPHPRRVAERHPEAQQERQPCASRKTRSNRVQQAREGRGPHQQPHTHHLQGRRQRVIGAAHQQGGQGCHRHEDPREPGGALLQRPERDQDGGGQEDQPVEDPDRGARRAEPGGEQRDRRGEGRGATPARRGADPRDRQGEQPKRPEPEHSEQGRPAVVLRRDPRRHDSPLEAHRVDEVAEHAIHGDEADRDEHHRQPDGRGRRERPPPPPGQQRPQRDAGHELHGHTGDGEERDPEARVEGGRAHRRAEEAGDEQVRLAQLQRMARERMPDRHRRTEGSAQGRPPPPRRRPARRRAPRDETKHHEAAPDRQEGAPAAGRLPHEPDREGRRIERREDTGLNTFHPLLSIQGVEAHPVRRIAPEVEGAGGEVDRDGVLCSARIGASGDVERPPHHASADTKRRSPQERRPQLHPDPLALDPESAPLGARAAYRLPIPSARPRAPSPPPRPAHRRGSKPSTGAPPR